MKATVPPKKETGGFRIKRVYAPAAADDGLRVLVDRLWPRGIAKEKARIDLWLKESPRATRCVAAFMATRANGRSLSQPTTASFGESRQARRSPVCANIFAANLSRCFTRRATRPTTMRWR